MNRYKSQQTEWVHWNLHGNCQKNNANSTTGYLQVRQLPATRFVLQKFCFVATTNTSKHALPHTHAHTHAEIGAESAFIAAVSLDQVSLDVCVCVSVSECVREFSSNFSAKWMNKVSWTNCIFRKYYPKQVIENLLVVFMATSCERISLWASQPAQIASLSERRPAWRREREE